MVRIGALALELELDRDGARKNELFCYELL
jgi:hypothetical protein